MAIEKLWIKDDMDYENLTHKMQELEEGAGKSRGACWCQDIFNKYIYIEIGYLVQ